jgi:hypothetical protein
MLSRSIVDGLMLFLRRLLATISNRGGGHALTQDIIGSRNQGIIKTTLKELRGSFNSLRRSKTTLDLIRTGFRRSSNQYQRMARQGLQRSLDSYQGLDSCSRNQLEHQEYEVGMTDERLSKMVGRQIR